MIKLVLVVLISAIPVLAACAASGKDLKPGDEAPAFRLKASDGKTYSLDQFRGKQAVVIAWFPKPFTGG